MGMACDNLVERRGHHSLTAISRSFNWRVGSMAPHRSINVLGSRKGCGGTIKFLAVKTIS